MKRLLILTWLSLSAVHGYTRLIMELDANVTFDLYQVTYPPLVFPTYYYPSIASPVNPRGVNLIVGYQRIGSSHSASIMYVATRMSGDFAPSVGVNQVYFAPQGELQPPPGIEPPPGNWRPFSILFQPIEQFTIGPSGQQLFSRPQDFVFKAENDDEPVSAARTIYYRLYGL